MKNTALKNGKMNIMDQKQFDEQEKARIKSRDFWGLVLGISLIATGCGLFIPGIPIAMYAGFEMYTKRAPVKMVIHHVGQPDNTSTAK